jgi:hypothetical protein
MCAAHTRWWTIKAMKRIGSLRSRAPLPSTMEESYVDKLIRNLGVEVIEIPEEALVDSAGNRISLHEFARSSAYARGEAVFGLDYEPFVSGISGKALADYVKRLEETVAVMEAERKNEAR